MIAHPHTIDACLNEPEAPAREHAPDTLNSPPPSLRRTSRSGSVAPSLPPDTDKGALITALLTTSDDFLTIAQEFDLPVAVICQWMVSEEARAIFDLIERASKLRARIQAAEQLPWVVNRLAAVLANCTLDTPRDRLTAQRAANTLTRIASQSSRRAVPARPSTEPAPAEPHAPSREHNRQSPGIPIPGHAPHPPQVPNPTHPSPPPAPPTPRLAVPAPPSQQCPSPDVAAQSFTSSGVGSRSETEGAPFQSPNHLIAKSPNPVRHAHPRERAPCPASRAGLTIDDDVRPVPAPGRMSPPFPAPESS